jgi:hypothetical protein
MGICMWECVYQKMYAKVYVSLGMSTDYESRNNHP